MGHQEDLIDDTSFLTLDVVLTAVYSVYTHCYYFRCHVATYYAQLYIHVVFYDMKVYILCYNVNAGHNIR